ncbi:hypothetical protein B0H63DRAFT_510204 [Podospora didyma]|uniref:C2H2-type domain-containing protein n=1 Tax=Podospora didyma TaxID=330526 RepID=A0AAE0TZS0_9PEZI|nr:hypothetical protein B0H63DRAFT_510204 [Podospora didyma]
MEQRAAKKRFACPYYASDNVKFSCCQSFKLKEPCHVKGHIQRKHMIPVHCPSCYTRFKGNDKHNDREAHIREGKCAKKEAPRPWAVLWERGDYVTEENFIRMPTGKGLLPTDINAPPDEKRWYGIFKWAIPAYTGPLPSPYVTRSQGMGFFRRIVNLLFEEGHINTPSDRRLVEAAENIAERLDDAEATGDPNDLHSAPPPQAVAALSAQQPPAVIGAPAYTEPPPFDIGVAQNPGVLQYGSAGALPSHLPMTYALNGNSQGIEQGHVSDGWESLIDFDG